MCCNHRSSVSSSDDEESAQSKQHGTISSLAHAMVQEKLDQMIRERQEPRNRRIMSCTKFIVIVAMEVDSNDPLQDFRDSMIEMITTNAIEDPKDLRHLLNLYLSVNSELVGTSILEVFYEVCTYMFMG